MIEVLQSVKSQLFDAPVEVKQAFNSLVKYFDDKVRTSNKPFPNSIIVKYKVWHNLSDYKSNRPYDYDVEFYVDRKTPIGDVFDLIQYSPKLKGKVVVGPVIGAL